MAHIHIIVGSMLGATEAVADELSMALEQAGHSCEQHLQPDLADLASPGFWLLCSSTHGAGDLPDNIQPFANQLETAKLNGQAYALVGLGDSSYDTFCGGAKTLQSHLQNAGATALVPPLYIDVLEHQLPEDAAVAWLQRWQAKLTA